MANPGKFLQLPAKASWWCRIEAMPLRKVGALSQSSGNEIRLGQSQLIWATRWDAAQQKAQKPEFSEGEQNKRAEPLVAVLMFLNEWGWQRKICS